MENGKDTALFDLRNQIYCTDCMELMAHIPDGFVSLILTDPPYGISYQNHFARQPHKRLDGDCGIDYERFAWESYRILRDNSHAYFFTRFDCYPYHYDCLQKAGFTVKNCLVVEKAGAKRCPGDEGKYHKGKEQDCRFQAAQGGKSDVGQAGRNTGAVWYAIPFPCSPDGESGAAGKQHGQGDCPKSKQDGQNRC